MNEQNYPQHLEPFEVVMLKNGVNSLTATPEDFKRVPVMASSPLQAQMDDAVAKEKGHTALFTAKPGVATDPEIMARSRAAGDQVTDRSKI